MGSSTVFRFQIDLSDVDRGVYEGLDFRTAQHPSETAIYLVTRVLAFALNAQEGLTFSPGGLSDPDAACMRVDDVHGKALLWIEVGNTGARKLHKAAKAADEVRVYTYKNPELLLAEMADASIYRAEEIGIFSFDPKFLERLSEGLERDNKWTVLHNQGMLMVTRKDGRVEQSEVLRHTFRRG